MSAKAFAAPSRPLRSLGASTAIRQLATAAAAGQDANYDAQNVADARKGRDGAANVVALIQREFQGEMARALGKGGDKIARVVGDMRTAATAVDEAAAGSAAKRSAVKKYNALLDQALAARQELVIQREAAGMSAAGPATAMRVDVMRDAMGSGPGESADDMVRKQYPLPPRLGEDGEPLTRRAPR